ncbi:MAG: hypothetical protein ACFFFK_02670 [Candidatus Thorarchaeota archaeon]
MKLESSLHKKGESERSCSMMTENVTRERISTVSTHLHSLNWEDLNFSFLWDSQTPYTIFVVEYMYPADACEK